MKRGYGVFVLLLVVAFSFGALAIVYNGLNGKEVMLSPDAVCQEITPGIVGCDESYECESSVCAYDPWCCDVEWDSICVYEASDDPSCVIPEGSCCEKENLNEKLCGEPVTCYDYDKTTKRYSKSHCGAGTYCDQTNNGYGSVCVENECINVKKRGDCCDNLDCKNVACGEVCDCYNQGSDPGSGWTSICGTGTKCSDGKNCVDGICKGCTI